MNSQILLNDLEKVKQLVSKKEKSLYDFEKLHFLIDQVINRVKESMETE